MKNKKEITSEQEENIELTKEQIIEIITKITKKKISLNKLCEVLKLDKIVILGYINELRINGTNIVSMKDGDNIFLFNTGDKFFNNDDELQLKTDSNNKFKFVAISDTRFGSKHQQLTILNDIYTKAYKNGYNNAFLCGNISEGLYPITSPYVDDLFLSDTLQQANHIIKNFPKIKGMNTYFITGKQDKTHITKNKISIGKIIDDNRNDMIYLGSFQTDLRIDNVKVRLFNNEQLEKTYTTSYRPQQTIKSFRSEDKPDVLLYGALLQMEKFNYHNVDCISIPSVCATTKKMSQNRQDNIVGAWYITITTNKKGNLEKIDAVAAPYFVTKKKDYTNAKVLVLKKEDKIHD